MTHSRLTSAKESTIRATIPNGPSDRWQVDWSVTNLAITPAISKPSPKVLQLFRYVIKPNRALSVSAKLTQKREGLFCISACSSKRTTLLPAHCLRRRLVQQRLGRGISSRIPDGTCPHPLAGVQHVRVEARAARSDQTIKYMVKVQMDPRNIRRAYGHAGVGSSRPRLHQNRRIQTRRRCHEGQAHRGRQNPLQTLLPRHGKSPGGARLAPVHRPA